MNVLRVTHPLNGASASSYAAIAPLLPVPTMSSLVGVRGRESGVLRSSPARQWGLKSASQKTSPRRAHMTPIAAEGSCSSQVGSGPGLCMRSSTSASSRERRDRCLPGSSWYVCLILSMLAWISRTVSSVNEPIGCSTLSPKCRHAAMKRSTSTSSSPRKHSWNFSTDRRSSRSEGFGAPPSVERTSPPPATPSVVRDGRRSLRSSLWKEFP
mmetsp:Transcript_46494/g.104811  ORF Transcript_46494/g.104811 Transcript_46494/m.104811 type:complete len:212 (+) Transcript_46494:773-1408(+)